MDREETRETLHNSKILLNCAGSVNKALQDQWEQQNKFYLQREEKAKGVNRKLLEMRNTD